MEPLKQRNKTVQSLPFQQNMEHVPLILRKITPEVIFRTASKHRTFEKLMGSRISPLVGAVSETVAIPVSQTVAAASSSSSGDEEVVYTYFPFKEPKPTTPSPIVMQGSYLRDVEAQSPPRPEDAHFFPEDGTCLSAKPSSLWSMFF
jgi:hypothetical protein